MQPCIILPAWCGVLILIYTSFPTVVSQLKETINATFAYLQPEHSSSTFPKTTLAAIRTGQDISLQEFLRLVQFCRDFSESDLMFDFCKKSGPQFEDADDGPDAGDDNSGRDDAALLHLPVYELSLVLLSRKDLANPHKSLTCNLRPPILMPTPMPRRESEKDDSSISLTGKARPHWHHRFPPQNLPHKTASRAVISVLEECFSDPEQYYEKRIKNQIRHQDWYEAESHPEYTLVHFLRNSSFPAHSPPTAAMATTVPANTPSASSSAFDRILQNIHEKMKRQIPDIYSKYKFLNENSLHMTIRAL